MKAVVTGSAGFIGSNLVDELLVRGYGVTGVDRRSRSGPPGYEHRFVEVADDGRVADLTRVVEGDADLSGVEGEILRQPAPADQVGSTPADTARCERLLDFVPETDLHALIQRQVSASGPQTLLVAT